MPRTRVGITSYLFLHEPYAYRKLQRQFKFLYRYNIYSHPYSGSRGGS
jgi:hypothetical protein